MSQHTKGVQRIPGPSTKSTEVVALSEPQDNEAKLVKAEPIDPIAVLRAAVDCKRLTDAEIAEAAKRRSQAGLLLAAAAIHRIANPDADPKDKEQANFTIYLEHLGAQEGLVHLANTRRIPESQREAQRKKLGETLAATEKQAGTFDVVVKAVGQSANRFEQHYTTDGKLDWNALGALYDHTDTLEHPVMNALPPFNTYQEGDSRRDATIHADRILRFMLSEAFPK